MTTVCFTSLPAKPVGVAHREENRMNQNAVTLETTATLLPAAAAALKTLARVDRRELSYARLDASRRMRPLRRFAGKLSRNARKEQWA